MKKPKLFLLHFAGGSRYSFQFMQPYLSAFEVIQTELPGRGRRMSEPLIQDFDAAAADLLQQIMPHLNGSPFFIYGHSMGALLSYKITAMLEAAGHFPHAMIITGNAGPGVAKNKEVYNFDKMAFKRELEELGGIPTEILHDDELFDLFEPILRADFKVAHVYDLETVGPVQTPVYVMMGTEEENVDSISNWTKYTTGIFDSQLLEGGHFFIHHHVKAVTRCIESCYRKENSV